MSLFQNSKGVLNNQTKTTAKKQNVNNLKKIVHYHTAGKTVTRTQTQKIVAEASFYLSESNYNDTVAAFREE